MSVTTHEKRPVVDPCVDEESYRFSHLSIYLGQASLEAS